MWWIHSNSLKCGAHPEPEAMLDLAAATYRHPLHKPTLRNPWATAPGPGVQGVSLQLSGGSITGLVGPNGAGKSTLMQMIAGILPLEDGSLTIEGSGARSTLRNVISFMPERVNWTGPGRVSHVLERLCLMRGLDLAEGERLLELVGLGARSSDDISTLSQGMKQRLSLATALLGDPKILLLDEPLNGLDPVAQGAFRVLLRQLADQGCGILISSHNLSDLESLSDEIILMHQGRVLADGPLIEIERKLGLVARLEIAGLGEAPTNFGPSVSAEDIPVLSGEDWAYCLHLEKGEWTVDRKSEFQSFRLTRLQAVKPGLENVISAATGLDVEAAGFEILSEVRGDA